MVGSDYDIVIIDSDKFTEIKRVYFGNHYASCFIILSDDSLFVGSNTSIKRIESFSLSEMYMKKFASSNPFVALRLINQTSFIGADENGEIREWQFTYS